MARRSAPVTPAKRKAPAEDLVAKVHGAKDVRTPVVECTRYSWWCDADLLEAIRKSGGSRRKLPSARLRALPDLAV